jgi:hypothetical protein
VSPEWASITIRLLIWIRLAPPIHIIIQISRRDSVNGSIELAPLTEIVRGYQKDQAGSHSSGHGAQWGLGCLYSTVFGTTFEDSNSTPTRTATASRYDFHSFIGVGFHGHMLNCSSCEIPALLLSYTTLAVHSHAASLSPYTTNLHASKLVNLAQLRIQHRRPPSYRRFGAVRILPIVAERLLAVQLTLVRYTAQLYKDPTNRRRLLHSLKMACRTSRLRLSRCLRAHT